MRTMPREMASSASSAQELAHDLEAEVDGGSGTAAGRDEAVDDDGVVVDDGASGGDGLDEGRVGGRVATVEHAQLSEDRGGRADRGDRFALVGAAQHLCLDRGRGLQVWVPGRPPGRNKTV